MDLTLSEREIDVLRLLADGLPSREIGEKLYISKRTVDFHLAHIYEKLEVHNRVLAIKRGEELDLMSTIPALQAA